MWSDTQDRLRGALAPALPKAYRKIMPAAPQVSGND